MKLKLLERNVRKTDASALINLETYTTEDHLIVSKAPGDKLMVGRVIEATALIASGADFGVTVNSVIRVAPDNCVIQVTEIGSPDFDGPDRYAGGKTRGSRAIVELVQRQRTVLQNALEVGWRTGEPILSTRRVIISLAVPVADTSAATLQEAAIKQADFLGNVSNSGFTDAHVLSASDVVGVYRWLFRIFQRRVPVVLDQLVDLRHQVFGPDQELDFREPFVGRLGPDTFCAAVAIKSFPEEPPVGLMNIATGGVFSDKSAEEGGGPRITTPFIFTTTVRVANQRAEGTRVQRAIDSRTNKKAPFTLGREDGERKLKDLRIIQKQCAQGEDKYVFVSTSAIVFGRTPSEARSSAGVVAGLLDKLGFDAREVIDNLPVRFAQALPLNFSLRLAEALDSEALMSSGASARVLPLYGDYTGNVPPGSEKTGISLITRRGQLLNVDIWRGLSPHGVINATTGAGKTVLLEEFIVNELAEGTTIVGIDDGRSLKKFCHAAGGQFVEFGLHFRPSLNGFSLIDGDEEFAEQEELLSELVLQMAYHNEEVVGGARIAASEAVKAAWANKGSHADYYTVLDALVKIVEGAVGVGSDNELTIAARTLVPRLKSFLDSPARGDYFRGRCTLDVKSPLTIYEMASLGESHLKKCVLFFLTNGVLSRLRLKPGRKLVLIDEAMDTLKDPGATAVVAGIYRKGRKDQVAIWTVFQSVLQAMELPAGKLIFSQSFWKLYLQQDVAEVDQLVQKRLLGKFNDDRYFVELLKSVKTVKGSHSEVLIQSPATYEVGRLFLDPFTLKLLDSEGASRERIFELMESGMDVVDAVESELGDSSAKRQRWIREFVQELRDVQGLSADRVLAEVKEALQ